MNNMITKIKVFHLFLILSLFLSVKLANAAQAESITVPPLTEKLLILNLSQGADFKGSLSISGGSKNDINFFVTDPQGQTVVSLGLISAGGTFEFTAQSAGAYTFHFGNRFSLLSSKTVTLSYTNDVPIIPSGGVPAYPLESILLGVLIGVILIVVYSRAREYPNLK